MEYRNVNKLYHVATAWHKKCNYKLTYKLEPKTGTFSVFPYLKILARPRPSCPKLPA